MQPLGDIRILSLEQYGADPFGSLHLAHLGAEIIKIEDLSVGGDIGRSVVPHAEEQDSLFFETFNRDKHSICLDVCNPRGRAVFEDLTKHAGAVYSNLRRDVSAKLRIRYDQPGQPELFGLGLCSSPRLRPRRRRSVRPNLR